MDFCRKCLMPVTHPSVYVLCLTIACTRTQPQGELSVTVLKIKSNSLNLIFQVLSYLGPACLSDFSSWAALAIQSPSRAQHLTNSLVGQVRSCFCDFVPPVSSTWIILLSLLCLVYTHSSIKAQPNGMEFVQIPLSDMTDTTNG